MVPNPAGGLPDTVARIVGRRLQERLNQSVVIENRPGANGRVAVAALLSAPADGYSLLVTDGSIVSINPQLYANLTYNPNDVLPVAMLARAPLFLAVHPKVPAAAMGEFIAYARARPGELNYGSSGVGSTHHLSMEAMNASLKLVMTHVPFKGTGESVPALLGGHIEVLFSAYPSLSGAADGNQIKLLATNGAQRSAQSPNLPSLAEFIPGFDFAPVIGIFARSGTPSPVVQKIAAEARRRCQGARFGQAAGGRRSRAGRRRTGGLRLGAAGGNQACRRDSAGRGHQGEVEPGGPAVGDEDKRCQSSSSPLPPATTTAFAR